MLYCNKLSSRKQFNQFCREVSSYTRDIFSLFIQTSRIIDTFVLFYFSYYPVLFHIFFSLFHYPIRIHAAACARTPQSFIPGKLGTQERCRNSYYVYFYCAKPKVPFPFLFSDSIGSLRTSTAAQLFSRILG